MLAWREVVSSRIRTQMSDRRTKGTFCVELSSPARERDVVLGMFSDPSSVLLVPQNELTPGLLLLYAG